VLLAQRESLLVVLGVYVHLIHVVSVSEYPSSSPFLCPFLSFLAPRPQKLLPEPCEHHLNDVPVFLLPFPFFSFLDAPFHDFYPLLIPFESRGVHSVLA
jgi:hypothetical protein